MKTTPHRNCSCCDEIHGLIGQSAFSTDYSRRIELIIQARNETHAISQFQKIREALSFGEREGKLLGKINQIMLN